MDFARDQNRKASRRQHGASPGAWEANRIARSVYFAASDADQAVSPGLQDETVHAYCLTPNRLARSAGVMSVGFRSNRMPASCSALATSETQPWPLSGMGTRSPSAIVAARSRKLRRLYFCLRQDRANWTAALRPASGKSSQT